MTANGTGGLSRRTFLKAGAAAAAGTVLFPAVVKGGWKSISNVIIVRFGGGVRFQETFGDPSLSNLPKMCHGGKSLLAQGSLYTHIYNDGNTTHMGATQQIITGKWYDPAGAPKQNPKDPTLFEFMRKHLGRKMGPHKAVVIDHSAVDFNYHYSKHAQYGFEFGGYLFQPRLITYHHLTRVIQQEQDQNNDTCRRARTLQEKTWAREDFEHVEDATRDLPNYDDERARDFIKSLFAKDKTPGLNSGDELVLYFANAIMKDSNFKPRLMLLNFAGPDIAHAGSYTAYVEQIRALDTIIDNLRHMIKRNPHYVNSTLLVVTPDCGRSLSGEGKGGFVDHWAGDEGCRHTWALFWGPGIPSKKRFSRPYSQVDLAPTLGAILNIPTPGCDGKVMEETKK